MNDQAHQSAYVTSLQAEHFELRQIMQRVRERVANARILPPPSAAEGLEESLGELLRHLEHHFHQEEEGGYLEEALAFAPQFGPQASKLLRQHPTMLAQCRDLLDACRACPNAAVWSQLQTGTENLLKELAIHEACENRIVQHAFNTDLGLND